MFVRQDKRDYAPDYLPPCPSAPALDSIQTNLLGGVGCSLLQRVQLGLCSVQISS